MNREKSLKDLGIEFRSGLSSYRGEEAALNNACKKPINKLSGDEIFSLIKAGLGSSTLVPMALDLLEKDLMFSLENPHDNCFSLLALQSEYFKKNKNENDRYLRLNRWRDNRGNCINSKTRKPLISYSREILAEEFAEDNKERYGEQVPYRCEACGEWHLSPLNRQTPSTTCHRCSKELYASENGASTRAKILQKEQGVSLRVYPCPGGGGWHLTKAI